ncbi:MAG: hypothetical protein DRN27_10365, partial [Thermoplasmata archaeon]
IQELWNISILGHLQTSPVVVNDKLYVGSTDKKMRCLDASDGSELWNFTTEDRIYSNPTVKDNKIFFGSNDKNIYCLNAETGDDIWTYETNYKLDSNSPTAYDDKVYMYLMEVGSYTLSLFCLDANTGLALWSYPYGSIYGTPAIYDDKIYIKSDDGKIHCLDVDPSDLSDEGFDDPDEVEYDLLWTYDTDFSNQGSLSIYDNKVFFAAKNYSISRTSPIIYCINANNGNEIWTYQTNSTIDCTPVVANNRVYFGSSDGYFYCLDTDESEVLWTYYTGGNIDGSFSINDDNVYFYSSGAQQYFCINAIGNGDRTTTKIWEYDISDHGNPWVGPPTGSTPVIVNGRIYCNAESEVLCLIGDNYLEKPNTLQGENTATVDEELCFTTSIDDSDAEQLWYKWDFGNEQTQWQGPYGSEEQGSICHSWNDAGVYSVIVKAKSSDGVESDWSETTFVTILPGLPQLGILTISNIVELEEFEIIITSDDEIIEDISVHFNNEAHSISSGETLVLQAPDVSETTDYELIAYKTGYKTAKATISIINVEEDEKKGYIYGVVYDKTGDMIKGARVCLSLTDDKGQCQLTDEYGRYLIQASVGTYDISIEKQGYVIHIENKILVVENKAHPYNFELEKSSEDLPIDDIQQQINLAVEEGTIGSHVNIQRTDGIVHIEQISYSSIIVELNSYDDEKIKLSIDGEEGQGKTILLNLEVDVLIGSDISLTYDGVQLKEADDLADILNADNDGSLPEYWIIKDKDGKTILVSVPHFSRHEITISSLIKSFNNPFFALLYIICGLIASLVFIVPPTTNYVLQRYFRKRLL